MPVLRVVIRIDKENHANDALHIIRDPRAGNYPPSENTDSAHGKGSEASVFLRGEDVREVILTCQ
jgi:hypothetical protein